jgi:drug/metabolite transporter (DMT)-like permease
MTWLFLTIFSAITFSISQVLQRILLKEDKNDPAAFAFVFQMVVGILILLFALFTRHALPNVLTHIVPFILLSLCFSLGNLSLFKGLKETEASEVGVLFSSYSIWAVLTAVIFLKDPINLMKIIGIVLIVLGVIVVSWQKNTWRFKKGHIFVLLAAILFGCGFTFNAYLTKFYDVSAFLAFAFIFPGIMILALQPMLVKQLHHFGSLHFIPRLTAIAVFYGLSAVTQLQAYAIGASASQVVPISQSSIVLTIILSYFFLQEKERMINKVAGSILMFIGVVMLA